VTRQITLFTRIENLISAKDESGEVAALAGRRQREKPLIRRR